MRRACCFINVCMDPFGHIFDGLEKCRAALDYHLARHNVLVSNIAHVDTPGYTPRDLARAEGTSFAGVLQMAVSHPKHMAASNSPMAVSAGQAFEVRTAGGAGTEIVYLWMRRR